MDTRDMDNEADSWVKWIIEEVCGLNNSSELTMRILENHLEEMLAKLEGMKRIRIRNHPDNADAYKASFAMAYQILALFLLETGFFVPEVVKEEVLYSTTWEYDRRWWGSDPDEERKEFLRKWEELPIFPL